MTAPLKIPLRLSEIFTSTVAILLCLQLIACSGERYTALMNAARNGDTEAVTHMIDLGASLNQKTSRGKTAVMLAAAGGFTDTVKVLVDRGADFDLRDDYGTTALIAAATAGHASTAALLIDYGADPTFKDTSGGSALSNATFFGHTDVVLAMLDKMKELPSEAGNELLLLAAGLGHEKIAKSLLDRGIDPNARGIKDRTPLMAAAAFDKIKLVKLLLASGADPAAKDEEGVNALQVAMNKGNPEIVSLLKQTEKK